MKKMPPYSIIIRKMKIEDIPNVVELHLQSFIGTRSTKLGINFLLKMYKWYYNYQPELCFVAILDEKVVGFVTGTYGWGGARKRFRYTFKEIICSFISKPTLLFSSGMFEEWRSLIKGMIISSSRVYNFQNSNGIKVTLDSIAVSPALRGKNIGKMLMDTFEEAAKKLGATYLTLGVESNNILARRLYENCGWQLLRNNKEKNSANYIKQII